MISPHSGTVPGPAKAEEPGAPNFVRAGAGLGGRVYEEPGECGLHVAGPYANRHQWGERRWSQCSSPHPPFFIDTTRWNLYSSLHSSSLCFFTVTKMRCQPQLRLRLRLTLLIGYWQIKLADLGRPPALSICSRIRVSLSLLHCNWWDLLVGCWPKGSSPYI